MFKEVENWYFTVIEALMVYIEQSAVGRAFSFLRTAARGVFFLDNVAVWLELGFKFLTYNSWLL